MATPGNSPSPNTINISLDKKLSPAIPVKNKFGATKASATVAAPLIPDMNPLGGFGMEKIRTMALDS